jgi:aryl-alcohol dehydrogenase-like predicted oxidoreductase
LKRLGVDLIDLYQMHHIDRLAPIEEIWQAMERLSSQGKITYVGSSNSLAGPLRVPTKKLQPNNKWG